MKIKLYSQATEQIKYIKYKSKVYKVVAYIK